MPEPTTPSSIKITKEFLLEIGGWRAMQEGRALFESGKVLSWSFEPPILSGVVQAGTSTVNARLKVGSRLSEVENLCSCRQAREYGTICPHVIALGLASMSQSAPLAPDLHHFSANAGKQSHLSEKSKQEVPFHRILAAEAGPDIPVIELSVILPVDFIAAWNKGQMRVILEASVNGQLPMPFDALPKEGKNYAVYEADANLLQAVETICDNQIPGMWMLKQDHFSTFFERILYHPRIMLGKKAPLKAVQSAQPSEMLIDLLPNGDMSLHLDAKSELIGEHLMAPGSSWRLADGTLELLGKLPSAYKLLRQSDVILPRSAVAHFFHTELPNLERQIKVTLSPRCKDIQFSKLTPKIRITLDGLLAGINCKIEAIYGSTVHVLKGFPLKVDPTHNGWTPDADNELSYFIRDREAERSVQRDVLAAGFQPGQRNAELYTLASENRVGAFLANVLPRWQAKWQILFSERMEAFYSKCDFVRPEVTIQSSAGEDWLSLDVQFKASDSFQLRRDEVQQLLQTGVSHHRMDNGRIALVPTDSVQQFNEALFDCHVQADTTGWRINKRYGNYIHGILQGGDWQFSSQTTWHPALDMRAYEDLKFPNGLDSSLRAYQKKGASWLHYLSRNQLGGILADEMGLGKTIQLLGYLDYRKNAGISKKPNLIVGPTSLVRNWVLEASKFTPDLTVLPLQGAGRKALLKEIPNYDLIITSYSLLRRDVDELVKFEFDTIVLDEAQNIKNRASQNAHAAKSLQSENRLVLTGTPVENSLLDLWSIFDFLMPGYLGPATEFRDRYEIPIAKVGDTKALTRLQQRIKPFVLRRTKAEVARDLPAKLEQMAYCELTEEQKSVYQAILDQGRREVFQHSGKGSNGKDRLAVLTALTRLRQVCCHLKLLPAIQDKEWKEPSSKMNYFFELIEEAVSGGHRVLVFSQFVSLLKLVESEIKARNFKYCYLDGATVERQAVVDRFQSDSEIPLFLISLKAGGTGLNLTGADTVIHFDPWWNPAVEDQATARAHRMGQSRIVTSYKLIARGTVEEKIVQLQQKKKDLISSAVVSEEAFIHSLTWEELQSLLE